MTGLWKIYINGNFMGIISAVTKHGACEKYCAIFGIPTDMTHTGHVHIVAERFKYEL